MTTLDVSPLDSDYEPSEPSGICSDIDCGHNEDAATVPEQTPQPLPEGGYGWVCVASGFLINAHTWGVNSVWLHTTYWIRNRMTNETTGLRSSSCLLFVRRHLSRHDSPRICICRWSQYCRCSGNLSCSDLYDPPRRQTCCSLHWDHTCRHIPHSYFIRE